ncbi:MAG TPA: oxidoreductase, partial [Bdellovibrionales bacterium]|nr:oxidoreductase [Bdellovibrionales bacterium]
MGLSLTSPADVARRVLKVIKRKSPPLWIPATLDAQIFYYLRRFVPRKWLLAGLFATLPKVRKWGRRHKKTRAR